MKIAYTFTLEMFLRQIILAVTGSLHWVIYLVARVFALIPNSKFLIP